MWIQKEVGKSLFKDKQESLERNNVALSHTDHNTDKLEAGLNLSGCPAVLHIAIRNVVKDYWNVLCQDSLRKPIQGYTFTIDTSKSPPVCCRAPRYGWKKSGVIQKLVLKLEKNRFVENNHSSWWALIMLAAKPHQEGVSWDKFQWRMCISYHKLSQVTCPFVFPIPQCNNTVDIISLGARYFIAIDLNSRYWHVVTEKETRAKLAFFTSDGKKCWKVMPMGMLNSTLTFVAMMLEL
eukprot:15354552-Ditylum_brightwellii.AAC.2